MDTIGGQAVIEGVMIRNKNRIATAIRTEKGIVVKEENFVSLTEKYKPLGIPVIRGIITFFETLKIGIRTLNYSADMFESKGKKIHEKNNSVSFYATTIFAFAIAIAIFFFLPIFITTRLFSIERTAFYFNIITGFIRIIFFLIYIYSISFMKDVKRLFMYHGAEHKAVNCYEHGKIVNLKNAKKYSTIHKRCGTSFLLIAFVTAIIGFSIIDLASFYLIGSTSALMRTAIHLLFLPMIIGAAYEIMKLAASKSNFISDIIIYPGSLLQKITTAEPDDEMIEVAISAIHKIV